MAELDGEFEEIERRMNIHRLKNQASELAGGAMTGHESEDIPLEVSEQFWQHVVDYEKAPWTTHLKQLAALGVEVPAPEELDNAQLTETLWQVINALAALHVYLECTDHLSDRELYSHLYHDSLREPVKDLSHDIHGAWHIDMIGSGSEEDVYLGLKYYWDEESRAHWAATFPDYEMPPHEEPPYDRDCHLPQRVYQEFEDEFDEFEDEFDSGENLGL